ncbi:hypothetical protein [Zhongshania borealis]|uniref:DUF5801 domain-containing protein n=1 Tax=Zhongshania borealis TaxID=889488 RepID=A0ABP7WEV0_9GAMM
MNNNILIAGLCALLMACGGGGSSSNGSTNTQTGRFLDSPVANIGYRTETLEGVTNSLGEYDYVEGETVTFFIGDLEFPPVNAAKTVTPLDLAGSDDTSNSTVVNILRLIQTLDEDGNPENGITINNTAKGQAAQVDFELSKADFESSPAVTNLVANSGSSNSALISENDAIAHFENTLRDEGLIADLSFDANTLPGAYDVVGASDGDFAGTHRYTFKVNGTVDIVYHDGTADTESWSVNDDGQLVFSGSIADVFTLTSGSQSSGNMDLVIDDADGSPVLNTTGTIERLDALFDAATLPGIYEVVGASDGDFAGTHRYTFKVNGTVDIVYHDGTADTESWSVNDDGQLVFSGSIADVFTLTSGSQSSGNMDLVIDDGDGSPVLNTTGTIERISALFEAATLPGVYEVVGASGGDFAGTHQYTFKGNGTVDIVYHDGTADTESWSVNNDGQLVFSGSIADVFTLTSGSQLSGNMDLVIDDGDGSQVLNTTGTIERISAP